MLNVRFLPSFLRRAMVPLAALVLAAAAPASAQVSLTALDVTYSQGFDSLASTGTSGATPAGWTFVEAGTGGINALYTANNGAANSGDTYSAGATSAADRAFATLASGSVQSTIGAQFTNNTGGIIQSLAINYTGEQWRLGTADAIIDQLDFELSVDATSLTTGTWAAHNALDLVSPVNVAPTGALDGNLAANRTAPSTTITGLSISNGATFWIRWVDTNVGGSDDMLGVDDFNLTPSGSGGGGINLSINDVAAAEGNLGTQIFTFTVTLSAPAPVGGVTFNIDTADNTATTPSDYVNTGVEGMTIGQGGTQATFDVTVNGDGTTEPNETFFVNVTNVTASEPVTVVDGQGVGAINNDDVALTPIHDIQGSGNTSPFVGTSVTTTGIVTGLKSNAFFLQEPDAGADANPNTSEGVLVFVGGAPPAAAAIGNLVQVTGTVVEFIPSQDPGSPSLTEITAPTVSVISTANVLPTPVALNATNPDPAGSIYQLEKYEGMRVSAASLTVSAPTQGNKSEANATSTSNGTFYTVFTGVDRPFREPGIETPDPVPAPNPPNVPIFDSNPERIRVDSDGQLTGVALDVRTGAILTGVVGPFDYGFRAYTILPDPATPPVVSNNTGSAIPVPTPASDEYTVASFNMERFFDMVNDPSTSDVVLTPAAYAGRLNKASLAIRDILKTPDIIGIEEMENFTALQDVVNKVNTDAADPVNVNYEGYIYEGFDIGGIDVAFMVNTQRVTVGTVIQIDPAGTFIDPSDNSVDLLHDRPSLMLTGGIKRPGAPDEAIKVIVNHLRSLNDVDTPGAAGVRVRAKRKAQAESIADFIHDEQAAGVPIVSVGDYNAFNFNDGLVDVLGTIKGTPAPADEVVAPSSDLVNPDLIALTEATPEAEYSYTFDGNAQTLDHVLVTQNITSRVRGLAHGRMDADFPEVLRSNFTIPEKLSDHDPVVARFGILPTVSVSDASVTEGDTARVVMNFTLTLSAASATPVVVNFETIPGTATSSVDYREMLSGSVTIPAGATTRQFGITVWADNADEADETFTVSLTGATGADVNDGTGIGTILDNDSGPSINVADASVVEGDTSRVNADFTVTLSAASGQSVSVDYSLTPGTATPSADYRIQAGTVVFSPGQSSRVISVAVWGDTMDESDETFTLNLANPTNSTIADGSAVGTILDNDGPPAVSISDATVTEGDTGYINANFTLTLSNASATSITVDWLPAPGTAAPGDYRALGATATFAPGQVSRLISVRVYGDVAPEPTEQFFVNLSNPTGATIGDGQGVGTIIDNE